MVCLASCLCSPPVAAFQRSWQLRSGGESARFRGIRESRRGGESEEGYGKSDRRNDESKERRERGDRAWQVEQPAYCEQQPLGRALWRADGFPYSTISPPRPSRAKAAVEMSAES
eukprot:766255-Hanusia_phi.AAC.3